MISEILYRISVTVLFVGAFMSLVALCWAGYGFGTLVALVALGLVMLAVFAWLGIADTVSAYERGRHRNERTHTPHRSFATRAVLRKQRSIVRGMD